MEKLELIYKFNGDFKNGVDIFELSPVLLSLGQLISESQKTLHPSQEKISINVHPFKEGSFEIQLALQHITNLQEVLDIIRSQNGKDLKELLEYIGLLTGSIAATTLSLIKLIKWLKGKPKKIEKVTPGEFKYYDNEGNSISVPLGIHALFQNVNIQQTIYSGIARPLEMSQITNIECCIKNVEETKVIIEKDLIEPIKQYSTGDIPSAETLIENENIRKIWVHPRRGSWEGESNSWSFRIVGTEEVLKVDSITDDGFLENIKRGNIRLAQSDRLLIEVLEKQKIQGLKESTSHEMLKIIEYVKSEEQLSLDFDNKE